MKPTYQTFGAIALSAFALAASAFTVNAATNKSSGAPYAFPSVAAANPAGYPNELE